MRRTWPLIALALLPFACKAKPPRVLEAPADESFQPELVAGAFEYRVGPGDVLRVNVFGHPELSSPMLEGGVSGSPVSGAGEVMLPLIGAVDVLDRTVLEVSGLVREALLRYMRDPRVDVAIVRFGAHRVLVLGEVLEPGSFVLDRPVSAMEAVTLAGGYGKFANRNQVAWVRGGLEQENLVLFDGGQIDPLAAQPVASGDVIFVGRRRWSNQAEAAQELLPFLAFITQPLSVAIQAATLNKID